MVPVSIAVIAAAVSGWTGYELASGQAAKRELAVAEAYAANQDAAIDAVREQLTAQSARAAERAKREAVAQGRRVKEALEYELQIARSARVECARDDESFRVLVDAVDRANAVIAIDPGRVPADLPADAPADRPERSGVAAVGVSDGAVGRAVRPDPAGM